jgi:ubiquinone/menaquinone biosynthesis C-methylase UbiE
VDLGAGSGAWAIEVAEQFPSAEVRGVDISPIQPTDVPYNCDFILADLNEDLNFADTGSLDLVHSRSFRNSGVDDRIVTAGIKADRWPLYMSEIHRILKPGTGWVQCAEFDGILRCDDGSVPEDSAIFEVPTPSRELIQFNRILSELFSTRLKVYANHLPQTVRDAGFIDVNVRLIHFNIGGWAKGKHSKMADKIPS